MKKSKSGFAALFFMARMGKKGVIITERMKENDWQKTISELLLEWYKKNKRDLPWRRTHDPYAVLVSEMMLQQTQVNTVIDYYHRFLKRFPDFKALSDADEQAVLRLWQGLGYYSRARNLHRLAKQVMAEYGGNLPSEPEALRKLPGIGDYMCGAVMSIAFGVPSPAVDGNVLRVAARLLNLSEDVSKNKTRRMVTETVAGWMPRTAAGDFTQSLMELGALVCKPQSPDCVICPLNGICDGRKAGRVSELPVKTAKRPPKTIAYYVLLIEAQGSILMQKRGESGLLAGMWGLPMVEKEDGLDIDTYVGRWLNLQNARGKTLGEVIHTFTHRRWNMEVSAYSLLDRTDTIAGTWFSEDQQKEIPIPVAFKRAIDMLYGRKREENEEK